MEPVSSMEYSFSRREETDRRLSFAAFLFFSIITLGIYGIWVFYQMIARRDLHFQRQMGTFQGLLDFVKAKSPGREDAVRVETAYMENLLRAAYDDEAERGAPLWTVLSVLLSPPLLGLPTFYVYYFLMDDFHRHDQREARFLDAASSALVKLGVLKSPIRKEPVVPRRSFWWFLVLTLVTFGFFGLYWIYVLIHDPNNHFDEQDVWENAMVTTARVAG